MNVVSTIAEQLLNIYRERTPKTKSQTENFRIHKFILASANFVGPKETRPKRGDDIRKFATMARRLTVTYEGFFDPHTLTHQLTADGHQTEKETKKL